MGHQIRAGERGIYFTDGAWLVVGWCERFTPDASIADAYESMGVTSINADSVKAADERVPMDFFKAKEQGLLVGEFRRDIKEKTFRECRDFLRYAASHDLGISGSY